MTHKLMSYKPLLRCHLLHRPTLTTLLRIATCPSLPGHSGSPTYLTLLCFFPQHFSSSNIPYSMYVHDKFVALVLTGTELKLNLRLPPLLRNRQGITTCLFCSQSISQEGRKMPQVQGFNLFFISVYLIFFIFIFCQFKVSDL